MRFWFRKNEKKVFPLVNIKLSLVANPGNSPIPSYLHHTRSRIHIWLKILTKKFVFHQNKYDFLKKRCPLYKYCPVHRLDVCVCVFLCMCLLIKEINLKICSLVFKFRSVFTLFYPNIKNILCSNEVSINSKKKIGQLSSRIWFVYDICHICFSTEEMFVLLLLFQELNVNLSFFLFRFHSFQMKLIAYYVKCWFHIIHVVFHKFGFSITLLLS